MSNQSIESSIDEAKVILTKKENWAPGGAKPCHPNTWDKAITFLRGHAEWADERDKELPAPYIDLCVDGSIDLFWEKELEFTLLVNIPEGDKPSTFYCDNFSGDNCINGSFDPTIFEVGPVQWLQIVGVNL